MSPYPGTALWHGTLKVGTLNSILKDVAEHLKMSKEELIRELWGNR